MTVASQLRDHGPMTTRPDLLSLSIASPPPDEGSVEVRPIVNGRDRLAEVRIRLAMDGYYPVGRRVDFSPRSPKARLNSVVHTTHRQNFLIPSRSRSFPLAEFLTRPEGMVSSPSRATTVAR